MSIHDQYEEARLALESGVAAVEKIIRDRDVETHIAQLRLERLTQMIDQDRLVREWFEAFNGGNLGPSEWFKLEVILDSDALNPEEESSCPQPCVHLSQEDAREGRTCPEHPCRTEEGEKR